MINLKALISASILAVILAACGGGDSEGSPEAGGTLGGGTGSAATGSISSIVGNYSVKVVKVDCDPIAKGDLTVTPQADGSCKITTPVFTETRRNILPECAYTLKITADGAIEMLQGTASKAKISCPASPGVCRVDTLGTTGYVYAIASGSAGATPASTVLGVSQIIFNVTGTTKSVSSGLLAGLNTNVTYAGVNPVQSGETGVLVIEPN